MGHAHLVQHSCTHDDSVNICLPAKPPTAEPPRKSSAFMIEFKDLRDLIIQHVAYVHGNNNSRVLVCLCACAELKNTDIAHTRTACHAQNSNYLLLLPQFVS